jgi:hypothetical protein
MLEILRSPTITTLCKHNNPAEHSEATPRFHHLLDTAKSRQGISGLDEIGLESQSLLVMLDSLWRASQLLQRDCQIVVRVDILGFDP